MYRVLACVSRAARCGQVPQTVGISEVRLERLMGLEPTTSTLARLRSTTELQPRRGVEG